MEGRRAPGECPGPGGLQLWGPAPHPPRGPHHLRRRHAMSMWCPIRALWSSRLLDFHQSSIPKGLVAGIGFRLNGLRIWLLVRARVVWGVQRIRRRSRNANSLNDITWNRSIARNAISEIRSQIGASREPQEVEFDQISV